MPSRMLILSIYFCTFMNMYIVAQALSIRQKYNFYLKDGSALKNVTLIQEKQESYIVSSPYSPGEKLVIKKSDLEKNPVPAAVLAQKPKQLTITLQDGSVLKGVLLKRTENDLTIQNAFGETTIKNENISEIVPILRKVVPCKRRQ